MSLVLKINDRFRDRTVEFFTQFNMSLRFDAIASSFAFRAVFNPDNKDHKELFCVGHYHIAKIEFNGKRLLTGYIPSHGFASGPTKQEATFGGYSLPGFLEDCQIPTTSYPLQMDGSSLRDIAEKLIAPFRLTMVVDPAVSTLMDEVYDKATAEPTQTIKDYLTGLAAQKNILITSNEFGHIVFTKAKTNLKPILDFDPSKENTIPIPIMSLSFDGQQMHSHIYVVQQADKDGENDGTPYIIRNPFVPYVFRPKVVIQSEGSEVNAEQVAMNALAEELRHLKFVIETDRWEQINGNLIEPNNIITVKNPEIYLYNKTKLFIEQVDYTGDTKEQTTRITCCLPEVYNGQIPKYLWEGINIHRE